MKKIYQQPMTLVVRTAPAELICGSINSVSGVSGLEVSDEDTREAGITSAGSRKNSLWDDEEEEEY